MKREQSQKPTEKAIEPDSRGPIGGAAAGILGLQRLAGNRAVSRALGRPPGSSAPSAPPEIGFGETGAGANPKIQRSPEVVQREPDATTTTGKPTPAPTPAATSTGPPYANPMTRADFELVMKDRFGVTSVTTGTRVAQEATFPKRGDQAPAKIDEGVWKEWDPGTSSAAYTQICEGFEEMREGIGIPAPSGGLRIVFYECDYVVSDPKTGATRKKPDTGAEFGGDHLHVFKKLLDAKEQLPTKRASEGAQAPLDTPASPMARTTVHELAHGVGEVADKVEPKVLLLYAKTVGWKEVEKNGKKKWRLFDLDKDEKPTDQEITDWKSPWVNEQPMSSYMVSGGYGEDFAEALKAYVVSPEVLEARSPVRYRFIDSRIDEWRRHLQQPPAGPPPVGDFPTPPADGTAIA